MCGKNSSSTKYNVIAVTIYNAIGINYNLAAWGGRTDPSTRTSIVLCTVNLKTHLNRVCHGISNNFNLTWSKYFIQCVV